MQIAVFSIMCDVIWNDPQSHWWWCYLIGQVSLPVKKGKGSPYSITDRRVPELIPVLGSQSAGDMSHKPDDRLSLLSARPAVTPQPLRGQLPVSLLGEQRHPTAHESSTLTTRLWAIHLFLLIVFNNCVLDVSILHLSEKITTCLACDTSLVTSEFWYLRATFFRYYVIQSCSRRALAYIESFL